MLNWLNLELSYRISFHPISLHLANCMVICKFTCTYMQIHSRRSAGQFWSQCSRQKLLHITWFPRCHFDRNTLILEGHINVTEELHLGHSSSIQSWVKRAPTKEQGAIIKIKFKPSIKVDAHLEVRIQIFKKNGQNTQGIIKPHFLWADFSFTSFQSYLFSVSLCLLFLYWEYLCLVYMQNSPTAELWIVNGTTLLQNRENMEYLRIKIRIFIHLLEVCTVSMKTKKTHTFAHTWAQWLERLQ